MTAGAQRPATPSVWEVALRRGVSALASVAVLACAPGDGLHGPTLALVGATVIDGTGAEAIPDAVVLVRGEHIAAVGTRATVLVPEDAARVDLRGHWITPGLIDAHVHFMTSGRIYTQPGRVDLTEHVPYADEIAWMRARVDQTLRGYLCAGVTSAISLGGTGFEFDVGERAARLAEAPRVFVAGGPVAVVDGGAFAQSWGSDPAILEVHTAVAAAAVVDAAWERGARLVNAVHIGRPDDAEGAFPVVLDALIAAATARRLPVTTRSVDVETARAAIEAGSASLARVPTSARLDAGFAELARARSVEITTTAFLHDRFRQAVDGVVALREVERRCGDPEVIASWTAVDGARLIAPATRARLMAETDRLDENLAVLAAAGAPLAAGSSAGNVGLIHGASLHLELEALRDAGLKPVDVVVAATRNAARSAGIADRVGTLEVGKWADLLVLRADPLTDVRHFAEIARVMKGGRWFDPDALRP